MHRARSFIGLWARVGRSQIAWVTLLPLVVGLLSGEHLPAFDFVVVVVAGALLHVYWWVVNDLSDAQRDIDASRAVGGEDADRRPIAWGLVSRRQAWQVAIIAGASACGLAWLAGGLACGVWMGAGVLLQGYANWYQKHPARRLPTPLVDVVAGIAFGVPVMVGASASGENELIAMALLFAACAAMIVVLNTLIGNQKDLDGDQFAGARTVALEFGVTRVAPDRLNYPIRYRRYVYAWELTYLLLLFAAAPAGASNASGLDVGLSVTVVATSGGLSLGWIHRLFDGSHATPTGGPQLFFATNVASFIAAAAPLSSLPRSLATHGVILALIALGVWLRTLNGTSIRWILARPWHG